MNLHRGQTVSECPDLRERVLALERALKECEQARKAAGKAEQYFHTFSEHVKDYAFITLDPESKIVSWSRGAERILGYSETEILGQPGSIFFTPEDCEKGEDKNELDTARRDGCAEDERWHVRADGTRFWASGVMTAHRDRDGNLQGYSKVLRDLTSRRLIEERLRDTEERLRLFAENVSDYALIPVDLEGKVSGWNSGAERTFGYTEQEMVGQNVNLIFTPEDRLRGESEKDLSRALAEGRAEDDRWMVRRDGSRFWARWVTTPMRDAAGTLRGFAKVLRDETERKRADDLIKSSLREKELLLREIHHRVKNNLQVITSIISLHGIQLEDDKLRRILDELQDRVRAIAALHETLYSSRDLANIDFGPYMRQLLRDLAGFHEVAKKQIQLRVETDDVVLSIERALPLGLIVNELVSNALKHGFPAEHAGTIDVGLRYLSPQQDATPDTSWCELWVEDDGVGISCADEIWRRQSMGLRLVQLFTNQLHGAVHLDQSRGTRFSVRFRVEEADDDQSAAAIEMRADSGVSRMPASPGPGCGE